MPKITEKKKQPAKKVLSSDRPPEWSEVYSTVGFPQSLEASKLDTMRLRNLQICTCNHDRTIHSDLLGRGDRQVMVVDCPSAGRCCIDGCPCEGFVFSSSSPVEGKKRRVEEVKIAAVVPPSDEEI